MRGFSLVELSIVLVILGLLTGGILTGQTLIRASELRAVTAEYQSHLSAVHTFRDKYYALPGDMRNATNFWGVAAAGTACLTATGTGTCDGDGDGNVITWAESTEYLRFWEHLAEAGLINGSYDGVLDGSVSFIPGVNIPRSKLSSSAWFVHTDITNYSGDARYFDTTSPYESRFTLLVRNGSNSRGALIPEEAWNIDTKMDDGLPSEGSVTSTWGTNFTTGSEGCTTASASSDTDATYNLTSNDKSCPLHFIRQF